MRWVLLLLALSLPVLAEDRPEKWYVDKYCRSKFNGFPEYHLPDGKRIDCMTDEYVLEFGFATSKYEDVGQSLYYSHRTGKKPGIVAIIKDAKDKKTVKEIQPLLDKHGIRLWRLKQ
jgi:hypothetical protein